MNLQEQFANAIAEAEKALEAGNLDQAKEWRGKAETAKSAISELESINGLRDSMKAAPMRPALPTQTEEPVTSTEPDAHPAVKAAYTKRFGAADEAQKAVLTDLHGKNYEGLYWQQKSAFNRYLRHGEAGLKAGDAQLLKQIVMTPTAVNQALTEGIDVSSLKTTMVEAVDTLGGYVVPVDFQNRIIQRLQGETVMRGRANQITTSRDAVEMPYVSGGGDQYTSDVTVTWVDETPTAGTAAKNINFGLKRIPVHTAMIETFLSRNLLEDSAVNLEALLVQKFAEAAAIDEDNQFLTGDGNGRPLGWLPSSGNGNSLATANSGHASTLTFDGLIELTYAIGSQYRQNAVWIMEKATASAISKLQDGNGQYLWREMFGNNAGVGGAGSQRTLLGYPLLEQEAMPTIASSAYPILFGDMRGYTIVDRIGMSVERYMDSSTARINQVVFVMRRRLGGQPLETWRAAAQYVSA